MGKKPAVIFSRVEQTALFDCICKQMDKFKAAVPLHRTAAGGDGGLHVFQWRDLGFEGKIYMFESEKPVEPGMTQYHFKKILKEAGSKGKSFHTLRHTFAVNCVENSTDVKALSELLGYFDARITLNRYVHPAMDSKRKQIGPLSDFCGQICGQAA